MSDQRQVERAGEEILPDAGRRIGDHRALDEVRFGNGAKDQTKNQGCGREAKALKEIHPRAKDIIT